MKRITEQRIKCRKLLLLFLCAILVLCNVFTCVCASQETAYSEYFIGNNRETLDLDGTWNWTSTALFEGELPDTLPKDITFDKEMMIPSYTALSEDLTKGEGSLIWYAKKFSLANKPQESVILDFGVGESVKAVYVNDMKVDTDNLSSFFKIGENTVVLVKEILPEKPNKYHFVDKIKLIFSNAPVITSAEISTNITESSVSFEISLYNARNSALKTDVFVKIYDADANIKGTYELKDVDVLENCNTTATITGITIEDFSEKTTWSANKPYVYTASITVSGDSVEIPFAMMQEDLFNTDGYKYGMDVVVSEFFANEKNTGYTWNKEWITSLFKYFKEFNWNVITFRDGQLPEIWAETALEEGILLVDKNNDEAWKNSQEALWKSDVDFITKATELKNASQDSCIIPVVYSAEDGLFNKAPELTGISKIRLQNLFKTSQTPESTDVKKDEDKGFIAGTIDYFKEMITKTFIKDNRYQLFLTGLGNTLLVAAAATLFGVFIGIIIAVIKVVHHQSVLSKKRNLILSFFNFIAEAYTAIIRGTPVVVQLLITYNVIFVFSDEAVMIGIFAFSINSGAYISEIIRAGINSVDKGQTEAGRSLGLSQFTTMKSIVLPQALKNILPALGNEFIALLKETSVIGYLGVVDLTRAGELIRSRTADAFFTLIFVAAVYFVLVFGLSALFKYFEKRLSKSDKN